VRARGGRGVFVVVMISVNLAGFRVSGFFWGDLTTVDGGCSARVARLMACYL
jgi:hypothetical protein